MEYSEWSLEYPSDIEPLRIVSEDRYLWTKDVYNEYTGQMETITTDEYFKELEGYEKIESSKLTYYRYILNDYVMVDTNGNVQETISYCIKNPCIRKYFPKKTNDEVEEDEEEVEEIIVNPKTGDDSYIYYISLIICSISTIILMILGRKKSSFVESL